MREKERAERGGSEEKERGRLVWEKLQGPHGGPRHLFKIAESEIFLKHKLIIDSTILNKWESFSRMVTSDVVHHENCIISPCVGVV